MGWSGAYDIAMAFEEIILQLPPQKRKDATKKAMTALEDSDADSLEEVELFEYYDLSQEYSEKQREKYFSEYADARREFDRMKEKFKF